MAFVTILTRHLPARHALLRRNQESLRAQHDPDYTQQILIDPLARGWAYARQLLVEAARPITAGYVWIVDDDDYLIDPHGIVELKRAAGHAPPGIIFRGRHAELGVLPTHSWRQRPARGDIGSFDFILRADVFRACVSMTSDSDYAHDHAIIAAAYDQHAAEVVWLDRVICAADARRLGAN